MYLCVCVTSMPMLSNWGPRGAVRLRGHGGHQDIIGTNGAFAPNQQVAKAWEVDFINETLHKRPQNTKKKLEKW